MALPTVTVGGKFVQTDGTPQQGTLTFRLLAPLTDASDKVIVPAGTITVLLNHDGTFSVPLVPSDASGLAPNPVAYEIRELFGSSRTYQALIPSASPTVDLTALAPVGDPPTPPTAYLQAANSLSDVASATAARANLGLGTAATQSTTAFDAAGSATAAQTNAYSHADAGDVSTLTTATGRAVAFALVLGG